MELNSVLFPACFVVKMAWISTSVLYKPYSKLYILTELSANDVKFISVDRQKLDLSKYICSAQSDNLDNSGIVPREVRIPTLADRVRILTLCGSIPELSVRKVGIGTK